jgi:hypothetical protein
LRSAISFSLSVVVAIGLSLPLRNFEKLQEKGHRNARLGRFCHMAPEVQSKRRGACVMNEYDSRQSPSMAAVAAGAAAGALAIYILRTEKGRKLLDQAITLLEDSWQAVKGSTMSSTGGGRETVF